MRYNGWILILLIIVTLSCTIQIVSAEPPIPEGRPGYLLPFHSPYANQSFEKICENGNCLSVTDVYPTNWSFRSPPFFLNMSKYHAFMNISSDSGDKYISEIWYFNDWDEFSHGREQILQYLNRSGTVSNITLDFNETYASTNNSFIEGFKIRQIDVIQYNSNSTSGYFIIFGSYYFPGPNYYIAYYGVVGSSDIGEQSSRLKRIMIIVPQFMNSSRSNVVNPEVPLASLPDAPIPLPVLVTLVELVTSIAVIAAMIAIFVSRLLKKR
ncbi:hypothetical protein [Methanoregula formicica]|uniref:Uncharacterized protein n=1 Tax=Methanoregula formicica (strain DSM 22288 / NBRC 105244 / SMSP) TaxID=593750 RepID=L0HC49_METFS|nr:hypothetical protein [Methanoregula formicica]AGB01381.1 hypothetical protein Metfor_0303 [Methanoregula formicica SMSP]